jgi:hypothetical protein
MFSTYGTYRSQSRTGIIVFFKLQKKTIWRLLEPSR